MSLLYSPSYIILVMYKNQYKDMNMLNESIVSNGMLLKKKVEYKEDDKIGATALKEQAKADLVVTDALGDFQADTVSINYLSSVVSLANAKYNKAVAGGSTAADAYTAAYTTTQIPWKLADNSIQTVPISTIVTILEESMTAVGNVIGV
jgi:hypothetical protein